MSIWRPKDSEHGHGAQNADPTELHLKPDLSMLLRHAAYHADMSLDEFADWVMLLGLGDSIGEGAPLCLSTHVVVLLQARNVGPDCEKEH